MLNEKISPMLAYSAQPFDSSRHLYEIKWDGTRCIFFVEKDQIRLQNRRLADITHRYPEFQNIPRYIPDRNLILDGELVILEGGKSDFGKLQRREHISEPLKIRLLSKRMPATYVVFDLLYRNDVQYIKEPLANRKEILSEVMKEKIPGLLESQSVREHGVYFFRQLVDQGLEGAMAKSLSGPYLIGKRSRHWLKIKARDSAVCRIVGYTPGKGSRERYFGALATAHRNDGNWIYRGKVGTGFTDDEIRQLHQLLKQLSVNHPPSSRFGNLRNIQWVKPELRCRVIFQEYSAKGHFRAPVFDGLLEG